MLHLLINNFKHFDKITNKILKYGLIFCFFINIVSTFILLTYTFIFSIPILYNIGIAFFRLSLTFGVEFIICSFVVDQIKKEMSV